MALKSITLGPGDCVVLPKDAVVNSIVTTGSIALTNSCGTALPSPTSYKCGYFVYVRDDASGAGPFDEGVALISKLTVGSNTYIMNEDATNPNMATLNLHITDLALFQFVNVSVAGDYSDRKYFALYFKTPENMFDQCKLQLDERGNGAILFTLEPVEYPCDTYDVEV